MTAAGRPGRGPSPSDPLALALARRFAVDGRLLACDPLGGGHIHETFLVTFRRPPGRVEQVVFQRVNTDVFADPDLLAANVARVVAHLDGRGAPRLVPTRSGGPGPEMEAMEAGADGSRWRAWRFVPGRTMARFEHPAAARAAGGAMARLTARLADLPGPPLVEPIAGFHDFSRRLANLEAAVATDNTDRVAGCGAEIDGVRQASSVADELAAARAAGLLPPRLVHNDAKAANLLFDESGREVRAVIDLDTVAPGTVLFDVGDLIRSGAATGPEDSTDVDRLGVDWAIAHAVVEGYQAAVPGLLSDGERATLPLAGPLMAFEAALRFLTDHLRGDVYFRIARPGHNLARARAQLRLFELLEANRA